MSYGRFDVISYAFHYEVIDLGTARRDVVFSTKNRIQAHRKAKSFEKNSRLVDDGIFRRWYRGEQLVQVEALNAENAARVCRRTMKPWQILTHASSGEQYEAVCYPFVEGEQPMIKVRTKIGEPGDLADMLCTDLRPIMFEPLRTGVPANDPLPAAVDQLTRRAS